MIELALTICALTFMAPYYDCSEEWDIIVYDSDDLLKCGDKEASSLGCSKIYLFNFKTDSIELVNNHAEIMGKHTPKLKGGGILWHELLHQMCECDWHEKWDVEDPKRKHRFYQGIEVPETVIPYLKQEWVHK